VPYRITPIMTSPSSSAARTRARELLLQALYQQQIAGHALGELVDQYHEQKAWERVDQAFFDEALAAIIRSRTELERAIDEVVDRPIEQLDPIDLGILLIGFYELGSRIEVPYRVVISEGVNLAKRFGATDGYKYINACLDKAARKLRETEISARGSG